MDFESVDELKEWQEALRDVVHYAGPERARALLGQLLDDMAQMGHPVVKTERVGFLNTCVTDVPLVEDSSTAKALSCLRRWNAIVMVVKGTQVAKELGGHLSTYASMSTLYDIGLDYFFRSRTNQSLEDLVYFQGHSVPGIYANSFLSGQLDEEKLHGFRQECDGQGLSSYPHPWLMPDYWQFATVSMGLGPLQAIYQARFQRYLQHRGLVTQQDRKIWMFCGDGEMDEPESLGAINVASREHLDNLVLVVNCNLQRLDGPVRGNGHIIKELRASFSGSGWHVIQVLWNSHWDAIFEKDTNGLLAKKFDSMVDGELQNMAYQGVDYLKKHLFNTPELQALIHGMSDEDLAKLDVGGHDRQKVYTAYHQATQAKDKPTVILVRTVKGYGIPGAHGANIAHNLKELSSQALTDVGQAFELPLSDKDMAQPKFYRPNDQDPARVFQDQRRQDLGGAFPCRHSTSDSIKIPQLDHFKDLLQGFEDRELSTTMGFVRFLSLLLRDKSLCERVVPIVPDESRTFGMEGLFRQIGIYAPAGQKYTPMDRDQIMYYKEEKSGQLLEEGVNEGGAMASWIAAATSYSTNALSLLPFYIYYSMFGFQRVGDLIWAAADMRARGFLLGATAGRTTLAGEGLQHNDGHSHVMAETVPNCRSYDPAFIYELVVILQHGCVEMFEKQKDVFYYLTLMNENYQQPPMPSGCQDGIIEGMYCYQTIEARSDRPMVHLMGSGAILPQVIQAAKWLFDTQGIGSWVWSMTSFTQLKRSAQALERRRLHDLDDSSETHHIERCMANKSGPVIAATDYIRTYAEQIRPFIADDYYTLGTDGFGLSDTRAKLRRHFEVDAAHISYTALVALYRQNSLSQEVVKEAATTLNIHLEQVSSVDFDLSKGELK